MAIQVYSQEAYQGFEDIDQSQGFDDASPMVGGSKMFNSHFGVTKMGKKMIIHGGHTKMGGHHGFGHHGLGHNFKHGGHFTKFVGAPNPYNEQNSLTDDSELVGAPLDDSTFDDSLLGQSPPQFPFNQQQPPMQMPMPMMNQQMLPPPPPMQQQQQFVGAPQMIPASQMNQVRDFSMPQGPPTMPPRPPTMQPQPPMMQQMRAPDQSQLQYLDGPKNFDVNFQFIHYYRY